MKERSRRTGYESSSFACDYLDASHGPPKATFVHFPSLLHTILKTEQLPPWVEPWEVWTLRTAWVEL